MIVVKIVATARLKTKVTSTQKVELSIRFAKLEIQCGFGSVSEESIDMAYLRFIRIMPKKKLEKIVWKPIAERAIPGITTRIVFA